MPDVPVPTSGTFGVGEGEDGDEPPHFDAIVAATTSPTLVRQNGDMVTLRDG